MKHFELHFNKGEVSALRYWDKTAPLARIERFRQDKFFGEHQVSQFLSHYLGADYGELHATPGAGYDSLNDAADWMLSYCRGIVKVKGEAWTWLYGQWDDEGGTAIFVPAKSGLKSFAQIGLHIHDPKKAPKRIKRLIARHKLMVFGEIIGIIEDPVLGTLVGFKMDDGHEGVIRVVDISTWDKRLMSGVAGQHRIRPSFADRIGMKRGGKITAMLPLGQGKGYCWRDASLENSPFDLVLYEIKGEVTFDRFCFGVLSDINPGKNTYTDLQSIINFGQEVFLCDLGRGYFEHLALAYKNEKSFNNMVMKHMTDLNDRRNKDKNPWILPEAARRGISYFSEPSLFRRAIRHLTQQAINVERGRMPMDVEGAGVGLRVSFAPDFNMFDGGDYLPENSVLAPGTVCCMDVPEGPVVIYRSPNGTALEHCRVLNVHDRRFEKFVGQKIVFFGPDLEDHLILMNGADLDDDGVMIYAKEWVELMYSLTYPSMPKIEENSTPVVRRVNRYLAKMQGRVFGTYCLQDFKEMIDGARNFQVHIGQIVNLIMLDTLLSGRHKKRMLADLKRQIAETTRGVAGRAERKMLKEAYLWLKQRPEYVLREVASNLEFLIDFTQMGKGDPAQAQRLLKILEQMMPKWNRDLEVMETPIKVYPTLWSRPNHHDSYRVSPKLVLGKDYVLANTHVCDALLTLEADRKLLEDAFRIQEWQTITPLPQAVDLMFPALGDTDRIVQGYKQWFKAKMQEMMELPKFLQQKFYNDCVWGRVHACSSKTCCAGTDKPTCSQAGSIEEDGLKQMYERWGDRGLMLAMAVESKRQAVKFRTPFIRPDGSTSGVPDGFFGNGFVYSLYMEALDRAGVSGRYSFVDFEPRTRKYQTGEHLVDVEEGVVTDPENGKFIGLVDASVTAELVYMIDGVLEIKAVDRSLTAAAAGMDPANPNVFEVSGFDDWASEGSTPDFEFVD